MERVIILIDGSNLYHGLKTNFGKEAHIDLGKFVECLVSTKENRKLVRTYYYNVPVDIKDDEEKFKKQQRFLDRLAFIPNFEVKLGRLERRGNRRIEKGVDILLATDMLYFAFTNLYDVAILVSGDGDFAYVMRRIKELGKHVEYAYFFKGRSFQLQKSCDSYIELSKKFLEGCLF